MYVLEPVAHETIWGGHKLNKYTKDVKGQIGHLYMINGHEKFSNIILNGKYSGKTLNTLFQKEKGNWNLSKYEEFPLTIALVDAKENLSIQVHPDDKAAECIEGERIGKIESWFFLEAPDDSWIYAGCECSTTEEVLEAVKVGKMEQIAKHLDVEENDYVCIEAGTLHAMSSGSLVYEIEYGSDYTYRFYDYDRVDSQGRMRELQIDKAIKAIDISKEPKRKKMIYEEWVQEINYEICRKRDVKSYINRSKEIECISVLKGEAMCDGIQVERGMSILLFPNEKLENVNIQEMFIARIRHGEN